jgi:hypothetical protein
LLSFFGLHLPENRKVIRHFSASGELLLVCGFLITLFNSNTALAYNALRATVERLVTTLAFWLLRRQQRNERSQLKT